MSIDRLLATIAVPMEYTSEEITYVLPSILLADDGLALSRILLVTNNYLCEVRVGSEHEFDFVAKNTIENYRVHLWTHELKKGDEISTTYELAQITFIHSISINFTTELSYAGNERSAWLKEVIAAIPVSTILDSFRKIKN